MHPAAVRCQRRALCSSSRPRRGAARSPAAAIAGNGTGGAAPARTVPRTPAPRLRLGQPPLRPTRRSRHTSGSCSGTQGRPRQPPAAVRRACTVRVSAGAYCTLPCPDRHLCAGQQQHCNGGAAGQPDRHQRRARRCIRPRCGAPHGGGCVPAMPAPWMPFHQHVCSGQQQWLLRCPADAWGASALLPRPPLCRSLPVVVPSASRLASGGGQPGGEPVSWDEMGQLGLHKALNEYYKVGGCSWVLLICCN